MSTKSSQARLTNPFAKLVRGNDYSCPYLTIPGKPTNQRRYAVRITEQIIDVRFPDGTIVACLVAERELAYKDPTENYLYSAISKAKIPGVCLRLFGLEFWVPLDEVEVRVNEAWVPV